MKNTHYKKAVFAGGCFWCTEACFKGIDGVVSVVCGYTGGDSENPTYESVSTGATGYKEAIQVIYDPIKISYEKLLEIYWRNIDPTDGGGQFNDRGNQYETIIFYQNEEEKALAEKSKKGLEESKKFDKPIVTQILPLKNFYEAEEYHQDYASKEPMLYGFYEKGSGRNTFLKSLWGDDQGIEKELKNKLSPLEYYVTQESGTEPPFENEYWDNKKEGIYVDVVSGEPLFSSLDKYDSGTGWPSFTKPLIPENIILKEDNSSFSKRIEVKSRKSDSHLGHVFDDGPAPEGKRYCLNSAALKFIARENLKKEGYGNFEALFEK